jgi:uncharacterized protein YgbK (DUF1537 family)
MLKEIKTQEIMTKRAAQEKYRTEYITMVITEVVDRGDNDLGYVIYTADDEREFMAVPRNEYRGKKVAFTLGIAAEPYPQIENVVSYE